MALGPFAGSPWEPGQAAGEPAAHSPELGFERLGEASSGTVQDRDFVLDRSPCSSHHVADSEVA
jgi:hypothetical protein